MRFLLKSGLSHLFATAILSLSLCACGDDDLEILIFTLEVSPDYNGIGEESWVIATDTSGKIIDASRFEQGQTITLKSSAPPTSSITITLFKFCTECHVDLFQFISYCEIQPGSKWFLSKYPYNPPPIEDAGKVSITVHDLPNSVYPVGDDYVSVSYINGNGYQPKAPNHPSYAFDFGLRNQPSDILLSIYGSEAPKIYTHPC